MADGVSVVEPKAFQSFIARTYAEGQRALFFRIPRQIVGHLRLRGDDFLEVAVRKISVDYAKENYKLGFFSLMTRCPVCGEVGRLQKMGCSFFVRHTKQGVSGTFALHHVSREVASKLVPVVEGDGK